MGKTGVGGEGETGRGGAGWHWGVVDGGRNLEKYVLLGLQTELYHLVFVTS